DGLTWPRPGGDHEPGDADLLPARDVVAGRDRAPEADLERRGVATGLVEELAQATDLRRRRLEVVGHADPAVAVARGAPQRGPALPADQDGWPGPLHRLREEHDAVEREVLAAVADLVLGPEALAHLEALVDA